MYNTGSPASHPALSSRPAQFSRDTNGQTGQINIAHLDGVIATDPNAKFPNLVVYLGPSHKRASQNIAKSFEDSGYGKLDINTKRSKNPAGGEWVVTTLSWNGECLAEGEAPSRPESMAAAVAVLLNDLRKTNYIIEAKNSYIPAKRVPSYVLNADPSLSHIYKVVCLMKPSTPPFPHPLSGSVDYVSSEEDMWEYIWNHGKSGTTADLFVLNVEKKLHPQVTEMAGQLGWFAKHLIGCSDRGLMLSKKEVNVPELLQKLIKCGGNTIKHRLTAPGSDPLSDYDSLVQDCKPGEGPKEQSILTVFALEPNTSTQEEEEVVVNPWIADNLILVERIEMSGEIVIPREMIFLAVRECPELEEFIIEKKTDPRTRIITAEALIDRRVVGRAKATSVIKVKKMAAADALQNLRKCCRYIEAKKSYFGYNGSYPAFLRYRRSNSNIYRIANPSEARTEYEFDELLKNFMKSRYQDLFFLEDFPIRAREIVFNLGRNRTKDLQVWIFGSNCVCVYKKMRAKQIYQELMETERLENEKFRLILPNTRTSPESPAVYANRNQYGSEERNLQNLFDFKNEDVKANKREPSPTPQITKLFDFVPTTKVSTQRTDQLVSMNNRSNILEPDNRIQKEKVDFSNLFDGIKKKESSERVEQPLRSNNIRPITQGIESTKDKDSASTKLLVSDMDSKEFVQTVEQSNKEDNSYNDDLDIWTETTCEVSTPQLNEPEFRQQMNKQWNDKHLDEQKFMDKRGMTQDTLSQHDKYSSLERQDTSYEDNIGHRPKQIFDYTQVTKDKESYDQRSTDLSDECERKYWQQTEDTSREGEVHDQGPRNWIRKDMPERQGGTRSWNENQLPPYRGKRSYCEGPGDWEKDSEILRPSGGYEVNREPWQEKKLPFSVDRQSYDIKSSDWREEDPQNSKLPGRYEDERKYWPGKEQSLSSDRHSYVQDDWREGPRRQSWEQVKQPLTRDNEYDQRSDDWSEELKKRSHLSMRYEDTGKESLVKKGQSYGRSPVDWRESSQSCNLPKTGEDDGSTLWKKRKQEMSVDTSLYDQGSWKRTEQPFNKRLYDSNPVSGRNENYSEQKTLFDTYASSRDSYNRPLNRNYGQFQDSRWDPHGRSGWPRYK